MSADKIPISTKARAKVWLWKRQALARFQRIDAVIASAAFSQASRDFTHKKGKRRLRALPKLSEIDGRGSLRAGPMSRTLPLCCGAFAPARECGPPRRGCLTGSAAGWSLR
jgi:hypothetical protein